MYKYQIIISSLLGAILASIIIYGSMLRDYEIDLNVDRTVQNMELEKLRADFNRMQEELIIVNAMNDELTERLNNLEHQLETWPKKK